jgi:photosystem II stability/assembly factor-like uncharacterized protein
MEKSSIQGSSADRSGARAQAGATLESRRVVPMLVCLAALVVSIVASFRQEPRLDPLRVAGGFGSLDWFRHPLERNAWLRLPSVSVHLNDVHAGASGRLWVVGDGATILHSPDGGRSWIQQVAPELPTPVEQESELETEPASKGSFQVPNRASQQADVGVVSAEERLERERESTPGHLAEVTFHEDGRRGWIVGARGVILLTVNGGATWESVASGTAATLSAIAFAPDGRRGWAVGERGTVLFTDDSGRTWGTSPVRLDSWLRSIAFAPDGRSGVIVGAGSEMLVSEDSGATWTQIEQPMSRATAVVWDGRAMVSVGHEGDIFAGPLLALGRTNADVDEMPFFLEGKRVGRRWNDVASPQGGGRTFAVGNDGAMCVSDDGGQSWGNLSSPTDESLRAIAFSDADHGWVVGDDGVILRSRDGGAIWSPATKASAPTLRSVAVSADGFGICAVGTDNAIWTSSDRGATWVPGTAGTGRELVSVQFVGRDGRACALGENQVLTSPDRGASWSPVVIEDATFLYDMAFSDDAQHGWCVGAEGLVRHSSNGGESWEAPPRALTEESVTSVCTIGDGAQAWMGTLGGEVFATVDEGRSWTLLARATSAPVSSMAFTPEGQLGWLVGANGVLRRTDDSGVTWVAQETGADIQTVFFDRAGQRAWAVGSNGAVLSTARDSDTWQQHRSGSERLLDVVFADAAHGMIVGYRGTILTTDDAGATWHAPAYRRYPAPWSWFVVPLLAVGTVTVARRKPRQTKEDEPSIADLLASDRPLEGVDRDVLGFERRASGVVRFLANEKTEPPLTLAITGEWGSGKSSLMNLIRRGLGRYDFRTIWFNAWHHQTEEHLLAALNEALKQDGTPPWYTLEGIGFRARLLFQRGWRNCVPVAAFAILIGVLIGFLAGGDRYAGALDGLRRMMKLQPPASLPQGGQVIALLFTLLAPVFALVRGLSTFASSTSRVGSRLLGRLRFDAVSMTPGLRQRFAEHFRDVTEALAPRRLVLFIDDLDRCQPENVVRVLELVNFLVSSGKCYVILGIAPEWVASAVGLGFKEVADEWAALESTKEAARPAGANGKDAPVRSASAAATRRAFALKYLSKLVNIEIPVPPISSDQAKQLLGELSREESVAEHAFEKRLWRERLRPFAPLAFFACLGALAFFVPRAFVAVLPPVEEAPRELAADISERLLLPAVTRTETAAPDPDEPVSPGVASPATFEDAPSTFDPGATHELPTWPTILLVTLVSFWALRELARAHVPLEKDSEDFRKALELWAPVVYHANPSPRSVKRYLNRVRYMAMCQRPQLEGRTRWRRLSELFRSNGAEAAAKQPSTVIPERDLVALAALHHALHHDFDQEQLWRSVGVFLVQKGLPVPKLGEPEVTSRELDRLGTHRGAFQALSQGIAIRV